MVMWPLPMPVILMGAGSLSGAGTGIIPSIAGIFGMDMVFLPEGVLCEREQATGRGKKKACEAHGVTLPDCPRRWHRVTSV